MPESSAFSHHPYHYFSGGAGSLLELFAPFLALGVVSAVMVLARWATHRVEASRSRARASAAAAAHDRSGRPVLASDAERDRAATLVSYAVGEGRLLFEEAEERIGAVLRSRHRHELQALVADLPPLPRVRAAGPEARGPSRVLVASVAAVAVLAAVCAQAAAGLWQLWPVAVALVALSGLVPVGTAVPEGDRLAGPRLPEGAAPDHITASGGRRIGVGPTLHDEGGGDRPITS